MVRAEHKGNKKGHQTARNESSMARETKRLHHDQSQATRGNLELSTARKRVSRTLSDPPRLGSDAGLVSPEGSGQVKLGSQSGTSSVKASAFNPIMPGTRKSKATERARNRRLPASWRGDGATTPDIQQNGAVVRQRTEPIDPRCMRASIDVHIRNALRVEGRGAKSGQASDNECEK